MYNIFDELRNVQETLNKSELNTNIRNFSYSSLFGSILCPQVQAIQEGLRKLIEKDYVQSPEV